MNFEAAYYGIRKKEGRIYDDDLLKRLPLYPEGKALSKEWEIRGKTLLRVMNHLVGDFEQARIMDLGCGNGWMCWHLSHLPKSEVLGVDLVPEELEQAKRVFGHKENLDFAHADIFNPQWQYGKFDVITLGASVQYFSDLPGLVSRLMDLLKPEGEIHIFDSPFYKKKGIPMAAARSIAYFAGMGYPDLAQHYHHHTMDDIKDLGAEVMYNPRSTFMEIRRKIFRSADSPFPWLRLQKD